jgi:putative component of toxin-antitoxin plasmid stabilization module
MSSLDSEFHEFSEFQKLMEDTTAKLKRMNEMQKHMRWQFGDPQFYESFVSEMGEAEGWMHSHC